MAKKQGKIRNALDLPVKIQWQQIGSDKAEELKSKIDIFLSPMRLKTFKPPWKEMKRATPVERRLKRQQFLESRNPQDIEQYKTALALRKNLFIGVNALSRAIENRAVSCGLLAGDVSPKILIKHVYQLARQAEIPMVVLNGLKEVTKKSMGFSVIAFGLKRNVEYSNDISSYVRSLSVELGNVPSFDDEQELGIKEVVDANSDVEACENETVKQQQHFVHLTRSEALQRAFHPPSPTELEPTCKTTPSSMLTENSPIHLADSDRKWGDSTAHKLLPADRDFTTTLKRRRAPSPTTPNSDPNAIQSGIKLPKVDFSLTEHHGRYFKPPTVVQVKSNPSKSRKKKKKRKP